MVGAHREPVRHPDVVWGTLPVGATAGGYLASAVGTRPTLWLIAGIGLLSCLPLILTREVRALRTFPAQPAE
ncbi:hypothetical protein [Kitasatospora sp. MBT66]|uniref:hypothetical protein n=1 Tax=Kitasatospora sp. MBT66 TaxID=1444769 RepID=UPI0005BA5B29|nr:hypothetical protein [Kitasatospora sp. MBT66]